MLCVVRVVQSLPDGEDACQLSRQLESEVSPSKEPQHSTAMSGQPVFFYPPHYVACIKAASHHNRIAHYHSPTAFPFVLSTSLDPNIYQKPTDDILIIEHLSAVQAYRV